jgi:FkbM family methyltransferase
MKPGKLIFFNFFRNILRLLSMDRALPFLTSGKGYTNFFVKCIPQNYQYPPRTFRKVVRHGVGYNLDISEYMEWVIYFDLNVEHRNELYPLIKPGFVIFDVGTNIGETLMSFAHLVGKGGFVYGFEPVPFTYAKCMDNLALNSFSNVKVENIALSDRAEKLFFDPLTYNNSGGIYMRKDADQEGGMVEAITLDEFVERNSITRLDFLKIDVEGFELNVLKGAVNSCKKFRPVLFIEVNSLNLSRQGVTSKDLINLIVSYGYHIHKVDEKEMDSTGLEHYDIIATYGNT